MPVVVAKDLSEEQVKAYRLADNKSGELADWNDELLEDELVGIDDIDMSQFGFDDDKLLDDIDESESTKDSGALERDFMVPPFSVLDTRQGAWQDRKKQWLDMGIKSEIGRDDNLTFAKSINTVGTGTSVFDPVLTEIIYKWFTPHENSKIVDPFAGGSVRGRARQICAPPARTLPPCRRARGDGAGRAAHGKIVRAARRGGRAR